MLSFSSKMIIMVKRQRSNYSMRLSTVLSWILNGLKTQAVSVKTINARMAQIRESGADRDKTDGEGMKTGAGDLRKTIEDLQVTVVTQKCKHLCQYVLEMKCRHWFKIEFWKNWKPKWRITKAGIRTIIRDKEIKAKPILDHLFSQKLSQQIPMR